MRAGSHISLTGRAVLAAVETAAAKDLNRSIWPSIMNRELLDLGYNPVEMYEELNK
ncbi:MAG TPA: hypothetical protein VFI27_06930 [candidate division Zixibacteria bacterium]|nr:hypothetical protein [candidate division Zixibacteria bacterium]